MNALNIDMAEVTRLTRAGRLAEAMALIQGSPRARPTDLDSSDTTDARSHREGGRTPVLDMLKPRHPDGIWTAPDAASPAQPDTTRHDAPEGTASASDFAQRFIGRIRRPGSWNKQPDGMGVSPRPVPVPQGARFLALTYSDGAASRGYKLYVPSGHAGQPMPLVVMLHGCKQSPDDFAAGTGMNTLAEEQGFLVAYPGQPQSANASRCWNWFDPGHQGRDTGEPALIAGIARKVIRDFGADPARVYAAGLSAGGAAAAILAARYPDLFAAVGIHSGLACGAASDLPSAFSAMQGHAPARSSASATAVPTIVFHGDADRTVHPVNAERIVARHPAGVGTKAVVTEGEGEGGLRFTRIAHVDRSDRSVAEHWILHGAGHAWSGGSPCGSYTDPRGPDASREMLRFFAQHARQPV